MPKLIGRRQHEIRRAGIAMESIEDPIAAGFADETAPCIRDVPGQLSRQKSVPFQGNLRPSALGIQLQQRRACGSQLTKPVVASLLVASIPPVVGEAGHIQLPQYAPGFYKAGNTRKFALMPDQDPGTDQANRRRYGNTV